MLAQEVNKALRCPSCGSEAMSLIPHEVHGYEVKCLNCGRFVRWTGKSGKKKRTAKFRKKHRKNGELVCDFCGITENEAKKMGLHFQIDHREAEQFGGEDTFENTRPLCSACHYEKTAREHRTKGIRKLLAHLEQREEMFESYLEQLRRK